MVICSICGKSKEGMLQTRGLGVDEAEVFVKCNCMYSSDRDLSDALIEQWKSCLRLVVPETPIVVSTGSLSKSGSRFINLDSASFVTGINREYEFRIPSMIRIDSSWSGWSNKSTVEQLKLSVFAKQGGSIKDAVLRRRIGSDTIVKHTSVQYEYLPGVYYCESYEYSVTDEFFDHFINEVMCKPRYDKLAMYYTTFGSWNLRLHQSVITNSSYLECEYQAVGAPTNQELIEAICHIVSLCKSYFKLSSYVSVSLMRQTRGINKVYDVTETDAKSQQMIFRTKVDGEHTWVVDGGSVWFCCRPDQSLIVGGWIPKQEPYEWTGSPTIIRCESLTNGDLVFIDVICSMGNVKTINRDFVPFTVEQSLIPSLPPMIVRQDHTDFDSAKQESLYGQLPSDGVVGIDPKVSMTIRVKEVTIDLRCKGTDLTCGSVAASTVVCSKLPYMKNGEIYECKLAKLPDGSVYISESTHRPDKQKPNSAQVVMDILALMKSVGGKDVITPRRVVSFCHDVREYLYSIAHGCTHLYKLIIDVGSGRLQSISNMLMPGFKYVICDPNLDHSLIPRGHVIMDITNLDINSKIQAIINHRKISATVIAYKGKAEDLLLCTRLVRFIVDKSIPVVYSFSLSHVYDLFCSLATYGAKQIASLYVYDLIDADGQLINVAGINMRILSVGINPVASVSFPDSNSYTERALFTSSFSMIRSVAIKDVSCIQSYSKQPPSVIDVVRHIKIVTSSF